MRLPGIYARFRSLAPIVGAIGSAVALVAFAPMAHAHIIAGCVATGTTTCPTPSPTPPPPTPTPTNAFISLDVTAGDPNTQITVSGSAFLPGESTSLYWDQASHVAGASNADANGNFTTKVKPFPGDSPGLHHLCASVQPNPCAGFTLQALATTPTPQPSPSPSPDISPSPSASPTFDTSSPTPVASTLNGLDLILKPPFVILPIIGGAGLALALLYWVLSIALRPRQKPLKSVAVAHLASRPDYSAAFGSATPAAAPPAPPPSAWADVIPTTATPTEPASPEAPAQPPPSNTAEAAFQAAAGEQPAAGTTESAWPAAAGEAPPSGPEAEPPDIAAAPDEPPDLPEPADY
jgi:hypothetical protein